MTHGALAVAVFVAACGDRAESLETLLPLLAPHRDGFERFDRWARRAVAADSAFAGLSDLEETTFAQVRDDEDVLAAYVLRDGQPPLAFGAAPLPPANVRWVRARDAELGEIDLAAGDVVDPRAPPAQVPALLVRRVLRASGGRDVTVVVAFARE